MVNTCSAGSPLPALAKHGRPPRTPCPPRLPAGPQLDTAAGRHPHQQQRRHAHHVAHAPAGPGTERAAGRRRAAGGGAARRVGGPRHHPPALGLRRGERVCAVRHSGRPGYGSGRRSGQSPQGQPPQGPAERHAKQHEQQPRQGRRPLRQRVVAAGARAAAAALCRWHARSGAGEAAAPDDRDRCAVRAALRWHFKGGAAGCGREPLPSALHLAHILGLFPCTPAYFGPSSAGPSSSLVLSLCEPTATTCPPRLQACSGRLACCKRMRWLRRAPTAQRRLHPRAARAGPALQSPAHRPRQPLWPPPKPRTTLPS